MSSQPKNISVGLPEKMIVHRGQYILKNLYNTILLWLDSRGYKSLDFSEDSILQIGETFYFEKINPDATKETTIWIKAFKEAELQSQKSNFKVKVILQILRQIDGQITIKGEQRMVNQGDVRIIIRPELEHLQFRKNLTFGQNLLQLFNITKISESEKITTLHKLEELFKGEMEDLALHLKKHLDMAHNEIKEDLIHGQFDSI